MEFFSWVAQKKNKKQKNENRTSTSRPHLSFDKNIIEIQNTHELNKELSCRDRNMKPLLRNHEITQIGENVESYEKVNILEKVW